MSEGIAEQVSQIKEYTDLPVVVGFGISTADHVHTVSQAADGVVVGSAIVNCIAENLDEPEAIADSIRSKISELLKGNSLSKE